jgi:hypothetical protein
MDFLSLEDWTFEYGRERKRLELVSATLMTGEDAQMLTGTFGLQLLSYYKWFGSLSGGDLGYEML